MKSLKYLFKRQQIALCLMLLAFCLSDCKKLVDIPPPLTELTNTNVYNTDATAIAVLTGIYTNMSSAYMTTPPSGTSFALYCGLSADELVTYGNNFGLTPYYQNALTNANGDFWNNLYPFIFDCNSAIEGLTASSSLTPAIKQQLLGEAEFMRAFYFYYLVSLYGDVPLVTSTNYKTNALLAKTPKAQVYAQVISDLKDAQAKLSSNFLNGTLLSASADRVRPSTWAATALLARVYLSEPQPDWKDAETQASVLISNSSLFSLSTLNEAFLKASSGNNEAIWQLQPVNAGNNTSEAVEFIFPSSGPDGGTYPVYLNNDLIQAFEAGDQRLVNWTGSATVGGVTYYYPYKYKVFTPGAPVTEYEMVLRLGEQYLIRAEAEAEQGEPNAINDLNAVRNRAGLANYAGATDQTSLLNAIYHERQVELFTEWGSRWLDLKRTGSVDAVMSVVTPQKGGTWASYKQLYPIPIADIKADPNLQQNTSY